MSADWLDRLTTQVEKNPLVVFQFEGDEWERLRTSPLGVSRFTIARSREAMQAVRPPTACLIFGRGWHGEEETYFGLIGSRQPVSTFEARVKVTRALPITPSSKSDFLGLFSAQPHANNLQIRLASGTDDPDGTVTVLYPKLSIHVVEQLAQNRQNHASMQAVATALSPPTHFRTREAEQGDAIQMALRAFGSSATDPSVSLVLTPGKDTALARVHLHEDNVIEHDARAVPRYKMIENHVTGYAIFEKGPERLEVYTANRRPLEEVFGVDLIYLNMTRQNIVMLQYKMLEPDNRKAGRKDWIYRPDAQLEQEIKRMQRFATNHPPGQYEYRLNTQVFYLKFVKRDGAISDAPIITPLDHFEQIRANPASQGPRGGIRVSFNNLDGRYLRQTAFLDLLRSGYIGAHAEITAHFRTLIQQVIQGNKALVMAVQSQSPSR